VLVEGIMLFHESSIREQLSLRIYVDATEEVRLNRRIERDQSERGRSRESVIQQWAASVKPMHDCFVEPTKVYASDVLTMDGSREAEAQAEQLIAKLRELIC
jgi:uridine kinase